jgi:hypothetical protein
MNYQDFRNLQEAYMEVIMNEGKVGIDDKLSSGKTPRQKMKTKASNLDMGANIAGGVASSPSWRTSRAIRLGAKEQQSSLKNRAKKIREVERTQKEQADLYDIILSHLLDEGYADTQEAAEAIMVNMSEEWRDDISELYKGKHGQSETEYQAGRSDAGKRVSGDENTGPRHYALGRSARPDAPTKPGEKPKNTPKLANWEKDDIQYRKANLKK